MFQIADSHLLVVPRYLTPSMAQPTFTMHKDLKGYLRSGTPSHLPPILYLPSSSHSSSLTAFEPAELTAWPPLLSLDGPLAYSLTSFRFLLKRHFLIEVFLIHSI